MKEWGNFETQARLWKAGEIYKGETQGGYFKFGEDVQCGWQEGEAMEWQEETEVQRNMPSK